MKKIYYFAIIGMFCLLSFVNAYATNSNHLSSESNSALVEIENLMNATLNAYNCRDAKNFYVGFKTPLDELKKSGKEFKDLFMGVYMQKYGKYISRVIINEQTTFSENSPFGVVAYKAVFEKREELIINASVMKTLDGWKIMNIRFGAKE